MLRSCYIANVCEAGVDEAGRGPLAGDVFAAAVVLPNDFHNEELNDSKQLTEQQRLRLRPIIEEKAVGWYVARASVEEIDRLNILNATILAMHRALDGLNLELEHIIVDGNRFKPYLSKNGMAVPHLTIVKGDATYLSIAAASVLAKTYRDEYMSNLHQQFPAYNWLKNKGYGTKEHINAIKQHGLTHLHRHTFCKHFTDRQTV
ncbi:MAG: ribonuclease HII [Paludibacteraceae bacterium]|nr:ribonuclease HII [Paludibacteraceae bacterium]